MNERVRLKQNDCNGTLKIKTIVIKHLEINQLLVLNNQQDGVKQRTLNKELKSVPHRRAWDLVSFLKLLACPRKIWCELIFVCSQNIDLFTRPLLTQFILVNLKLMNSLLFIHNSLVVYLRVALIIIDMKWCLNKYFVG